MEEERNGHFDQIHRTTKKVKRRGTVDERRRKQRERKKERGRRQNDVEGRGGREKAVEEAGKKICGSVWGDAPTHRCHLNPTSVFKSRAQTQRQRFASFFSSFSSSLSLIITLIRNEDLFFIDGYISSIVLYLKQKYTAFGLEIIKIPTCLSVFPQEETTPRSIHTFFSSIYILYNNNTHTCCLSYKNVNT